MTRVKFLLAGIFASALFLGSSLASAAPIINGGFETGDLSGWTASIPPGAAVNVVNSFAGNVAAEGSRFALLTPSTQGILTILSQAVQVPAGTTISGWAFFFDAETADQTVFCDRGTVGVVLNGGASAPVLFSANTCATSSSATTGWTFFQWQTRVAGTLQIQGTVVNIGDSAVPSRLALDGVQIVEPPAPRVGAIPLGGHGTRDNLARQAAADTAAQQAANAVAAAVAQQTAGALRPPNTGDAGLLNETSKSSSSYTALAAVLGLTLMGAGVLRLRLAATRR